MLRETLKSKAATCWWPEPLQQTPARFRYTDVQRPVKGPELVRDALPGAVKNGLLIKTSVLGWGKHVTPSQYVHMDTSLITYVFKAHTHKKAQN